ELNPPVRATDVIAALRLELECPPDIGFDKLELDRLRLHIDAEPNLASTLYELLCNSCVQVVFGDMGRGGRSEPLALPGTAVEPVGFGEGEGMLPFVRRSFVGYRLLQEYFTFPQKFFFVDVAGLEALRGSGIG